MNKNFQCVQENMMRAGDDELKSKIRVTIPPKGAAFKGKVIEASSAESKKKLAENKEQRAKTGYGMKKLALKQFYPLCKGLRSVC